MTDLSRDIAMASNQEESLRARIAVLEKQVAAGKDTEHALRQQRAIVRTVVSSAPIILFALDNQGLFTLSEGNGLESLGLKPGQVVGESAFEMYADHPELVGQLSRALNGESFSVQVQLEDVHFETRYSPLYDAAGHVDGCIGVATDITKEADATGKLRQSEQRFRLLAENIPGVVYLCNNDVRYTMLFLNDAVEDLTGYSKQAFLDDETSFVELFHPEDSPLIAPAVEAALSAKKPFHLTYRLRHKDGHYVWCEEVGTGVFEEDKLLYIEGFLMDVTARIESEQAIRIVHDQLEQRVAERTANLEASNKQLEVEIRERSQAEKRLLESDQRFRQLAENIDSIFWMVEVGLEHAIYVSPAFEIIWGRPVAEAYQPLGWANGIHPDDRVRVKANFKKNVLKGKYRQSYRVVRPDGEIRHISDRGFPIRDSKGEIYRVAGVAQDVTEQVISKQRSRENQEMLAHVLRVATMGEMASGIAHEINQPLAAITNYISGCQRRLASGSLSDSDLKEVMERISTQATRASDILRTTRRFMDRQEISREFMNFNGSIKNTIALVDFDIEDHHVDVALELGTDLPLVQADRIQIEQVIVNLVRNSIDAMENNAPDQREIRITSHTIEQDGLRYVIATLRDSGPGIDEETASRLFEPLFSTKSSGLGMGLSISASIMEEHSGRIELLRDDLPGACFRLLLPAFRKA